jgi:hypothetical protein
MDFASQLNFVKHINYEFNRETGIVDELNVLLETDTTLLDSTLSAMEYVRGDRGLRDYSYALLYTVHKHNPEKALKMLRLFAKSSIGCWKDVRNFAKHFKKYTKSSEYIQVAQILGIYNEQLREDWDAFNRGRQHRYYLSFAAKYAPRETKDREAFEILVCDWFKIKFTAINSWHRMTYRKMVSKLNAAIDTLEVKMCAKDWALIVPQNIPCAAFVLNQGNLSSKSPHLLEYYETSGECATYYYMKNPWQIVRKLLGSNVDAETVNKMNEYWREYVTVACTTVIPDYYIPVLDLSPSIHFNQQILSRALVSAMSFAAKSHFGNHILTFSQKVVWVDLTDCPLNIALERLLGVSANVQGCACCVMKLLSDAFRSANMIEEDLEKVKVAIITNEKVTNVECGKFYRLIT